MQPSPGLRVVRGPDWEWKDQDGGEGHVGTVSGEDKEGRVVVQWDGGERARYRCGGPSGKYDLRVVDSGPAGEVHKRLKCSWCDESPVVGTIWKCVCCLEYYLCMACYMADKHSILHAFEFCQASDLRNRVRVSPRYLSRKKVMNGLFPEATVVRGHNWKWGNQDGGNEGHIIKIGNWKDETYRSVAVVSWTHAPSHNVYRRGHRGMVDIRCVVHTSGGSYYPDHLPVLGKEFMLHEDSPLVSAGDSVMVNINPDTFQLAQHNSGGWNDNMAELIGEVGRVHSIITKGSMMVFYGDHKRFMINSMALQKVDHVFVEFGDLVQISDDIVEVQKFQKGHGEWAEEMSESLGHVGRVVNVFQSAARVCVRGRRWTFHPKCVSIAKDESTKLEDEHDVYISKTTRHLLLSMLQSGSVETVRLAAEVGDASTLALYLDQHPLQVKHLGEDIGSMVIAIKENHKQVIQILLEHGVDVNYRAKDGRTSLHHCTIVGNYEMAELLMEHGADVNLPDCQGVSPIAMAALLGQWRVLQVLITDPAANPNCQTGEGDTPLHLSSMHEHWLCCRLLLENGADPSLYNFEMITPLHRMCQTGFLAGLEQMILYHPEHINLKKDDGFNPLLMACVNNHVDLVALLVSHPSCVIDAQTSTRAGALHLAAYSGHTAIVEVLVGYGANLNLTSPDGSAALHVLLGRDVMEEPDMNSPRIREFKEDFEGAHGVGLLSMATIVAFFLAANGADIRLKNMLGKTPINCVSPDVKELLCTYSENRLSFHGSLKQKAQTFTDPPRPIKQQSVVDRSTRSSASSVSREKDRSSLPEATPPRLPSPPPPPPSQKQEAIAASKEGNVNSEPQLLQHLQYLEKEKYVRSVSTGAIPPRATTAPVSSLAALHITTTTTTTTITASSTAVSTSSVLPPAPHLLPQSSSGDEGCCLLCDERCDLVFLPCGHITMCHSCGKTARKCSQCRKRVTESLLVCILCHTQNSPVSSFSCGHPFCSKCKGQACKICNRTV